METVKLDWNMMTADQIITVWMKPDEQTDTAGDRRVTNLEWCQIEGERVKRKGKNAVIVNNEKTGDIALARR